MISMRRFVIESVCFVVGLAAFSAIILPEHHNLESLNYSFLQKVSRHPFEACVVLVAWGVVAFLTIRHVVGPSGNRETSK